MKTAVSMDNTVYQQIMLLAIQQLNAYYDAIPSKLDSGLKGAAYKLLASEDW
jgi:hypothetical protein